MKYLGGEEREAEEAHPGVEAKEVGEEAIGCSKFGPDAEDPEGEGGALESQVG